MISQSVYSVIILDIGNGMEDVFQLLRLCDQILMPCAEDVYAMAKIAQYQHMLKVLRYQELESRTMYINMGKNMRQTVKETVELLKEPMWPFTLSGRLLIVALVGRYPAN